jgi:hypothetical protein
MFNVIKANITPQEAEELYPNNNIVMLYPRENDSETTGDVVYVGDVDGAWDFADVSEPPEGYNFYMLRGLNLRELAPIYMM